MFSVHYFSEMSENFQKPKIKKKIFFVKYFAKFFENF